MLKLELFSLKTNTLGVLYIDHRAFSSSLEITKQHLRPRVRLNFRKGG